MRVAIGSDHAGFALKEAVKAFLSAERREVLDLASITRTLGQATSLIDDFSGIATTFDSCNRVLRRATSGRGAGPKAGCDLSLRCGPGAGLDNVCS
jgi:hypothetical protein